MCVYYFMDMGESGTRRFISRRLAAVTVEPNNGCPAIMILYNAKLSPNEFSCHPINTASECDLDSFEFLSIVSTFHNFYRDSIALIVCDCNQS